MNELLLLLALAFTDPINCILQGYVSKFEQSEIITFTPGNYCPIRVTTDESQLVMYSPYHWVTVKIPAEKGNRRFQYRFGSDVAHLEAETIPVVWGNVNRS